MVGENMFDTITVTESVSGSGVINKTMPLNHANVICTM